MTSPEMKKAPAATGAIKSEPNNQEGEQTMTTLPSSKPDEFATIRVAGQVVATGIMTRGNEPDTNVVTLRTPDDLLALTPGEACALAAALQSVAVYVMEQDEAVAA